MKCLKLLVMILIICTGAVAAYLYSGIYDVAATAEDSGFTHWVLGTVQKRSIDHAAGTIVVPSLNAPAMEKLGFKHYQEMCVGCHLAPGEQSSEIREGLNPRPPALARVAKYIPANKMFWVIKHGIRMTGMPAWGPSHDDQTIWALVAFVKNRLPYMTPAEYKLMSTTLKKDEVKDHAPPADSKQENSTP